MAKFYVYIMRCTDGSYYAGSAGGERQKSPRTDEKSKQAKSVVDSVYAETFDTKAGATERFREFKAWSVQEKDQFLCDRLAD